MKITHLKIGDTLNLKCNFYINAKTKELDIDIEELKEAINLFIQKWVDEMYSKNNT